MSALSPLTTSEAERLAAELLPCQSYQDCIGGEHNSWCRASYRPAFARALAAKNAEIGALKAVLHEAAADYRGMAASIKENFPTVYEKFRAELEDATLYMGEMAASDDAAQYALAAHLKDYNRAQKAEDERDAALADKRRLGAEIVEGREALEFYANPDHYVTTSTGFMAQYEPNIQRVIADRGHKARAALSASQKDA